MKGDVVGVGKDFVTGKIHSKLTDMAAEAGKSTADNILGKGNPISGYIELG